ncbi:hypothetical protein F2Q70_00012022 [Brassica cretica]|uniref:Uncharacterized protein n=1 Tax=Brassica cretica TaxID=69181 RepID=A0A8S9LY15_BRACR|nr:hypothetical protein F2Q68_00005122 [Brassica cretica]KAF2612654.1 hypothetical protein F2Q70_00012022 [Brassica cretica]
MIEDPMYVLLSFLGLSEEHPQPMGKVSLLKWLVKGNPENSLSEAIHLLLIDSPFEMLRNLFLSSPQVVLDIYRRRHVRGGRQSTLGELCQSSVESGCRSASGSWCQSMANFLMRYGLGG